MPAVSVQVTGLDEAARDLARVGDDIADLALDRTATEAAETARGFTPRRSGALAAGIQASVVGGAVVVTFGSSRVLYAGPILHGWRARNIKPAATIARTDAVMDTRAPVLFAEELDQITDKYGFTS